VRTERGEGGLDVMLADGGAPAPEAPLRATKPSAPRRSRVGPAGRSAPRTSASLRRAPATTSPRGRTKPRARAIGGPLVFDVQPDVDEDGPSLGPRSGSTRRRGGDEPPPLYEGQVAVAEDCAAPV
jgi:hypothetical protein